MKPRFLLGIALMLTLYSTAWEIEVENDQPEIAKEKLINFLTEEKISFKESTRSKFGTLLSGSLD